MNKVRLVNANSQIRFMSQYFLEKDHAMIHGAEICGEYLEDDEFAKQIADDKKSARELFSFEFISEAIRHVFPEYHSSLLTDLVELIIFDAITGNNDRHFYNWAIIRPIKRNAIPPIFSPIYDSARALMWNWSNEKLKIEYENHCKGGTKIEKYIQQASPRISIEGNAEINHFELISYLWNHHPVYQETIRGLISFEKEQNVLNMYDKEFRHFFTDERNSLIHLVLKRRFNILRQIVEL